MIGSNIMAAPVPTSTVRVWGGDVPSRGVGVLSELGTPSLTEDGSVVFAANLRDEGFLTGNGAFRQDSPGATTQTILLLNDPAPDLNGYVDSIQSQVINGNGDVGFSLGYRSTLASPYDAIAIGLAEADGGPFKLSIRGNQLAPDGVDRFLYLLYPHLSATGRFVFLGQTTAGEIGVYGTDGTTTEEFARWGDTGPDGGTWNADLVPLFMDQTGRACFIGRTTTSNYGLYRADSSGATKLLRIGDDVPDGPGKIAYLGYAQLGGGFNDSGTAAVNVDLSQTALGTADNSGIYRADGTDLVKIARKSEFVPGGNGRFQWFGIPMALNNSGQVLFHAQITGATDGAIEGLFVGDGSSVWSVARIHDPAPGGGRFAAFYFNANDPGERAINDAGQVVFFAAVDLEDGGTTFDVRGLFLHDSVHGLLSVVRTGDLLPGRGVISHVFFRGGTGARGLANSGFNTQGQVAYSCYAGPGEAIVLWSLEQPQPPFSISGNLAVGPGSLTISWPAGFTDVLVERSTNVPNPETWDPVEVVPQLVNDEYQASIPTSGPQGFFRLRRAASP